MGERSRSGSKGWFGWFVVLIVAAVVVVAVVFTIRNRSSDSGKAAPVPGPPGAIEKKYADALNVAMQFFDIQKSGKLVNNKIPWRGDSALDDGSEAGLDLSKGMYDAGDHMKFGLPMAFSATVLSWAILEYGDQMSAVNQLESAQDSLKWITDYLISAHPSENVLYIQVGDPKLDHDCWDRPEVMTEKRPLTQVNTTSPGTEVAAETAAAMASASLVFKKINSTYSDLLLKHAQQLFTFADKYQASYSLKILQVQEFYNSSGYGDELLWAAGWLYHATGDQWYLEYVTVKHGKAFANWGSPTWFSWDDKLAGTQVLLSRVSLFGKGGSNSVNQGLQMYRKTAEAIMCGLLPDSPTTTSSRTKSNIILNYHHAHLCPYQYENVDKADWVLCNTFYKLDEEVLDWMIKHLPLRTIGRTLPSMYLDKQMRECMAAASLFNWEVFNSSWWRLMHSTLVYNEECESKDWDKFAKGKGDRISELPDEILVFILSFLTLKEAAVTSVVARRWMPLWASISHLYFDAAKSLHRFTFLPNSYGLEREKYVNLVNRVLGLHNGPCLKEFRIHFDLDKTCQGDINEWLRFALTKRLQRLELDFSQSHYNYNPDSSVYYTFPFHQLGPAFLGINPRLFIGFNSLKALHLNCVHVTGGAVECILSICSLLETLSVWRSHDFGSLKVAGPLNLNYLEISDCRGINTLQIYDTPNLVSFIYRGPLIILRLENVPLLTQVCLGGIMSSACIRNILCSLLTCCFSQLQILSLEISSPVEFDAFGVFPRFPKLKHLTLLSGAHQEVSLLGVTKLIQGAPYLHKFELQHNHCRTNKRTHLEAICHKSALLVNGLDEALHC